jgi:hypothetical protein
LVKSNFKTLTILMSNFLTIMERIYMKKTSVIAGLLFSSTLSFTANAVDLLNVKDFPSWFQEAMVRESELKETSTLKLEQFNVDSNVKGKYKLIDDSDGTWVYNVDIGTASPVECYVFSDFDGPATSLYSVMEYALSGAETLNKKSLSGKFNYSIDSGVIDNTPYLSLDTLYNLGKGDEKVTGILKGISAQTSQGLQLCVHNEIGYRQTFFKVFESFVQAFLENEDNSNFFETLYRVTINETPMGYAQERYAKDEDGDIKILNHSAMLVPVDASSISRSDTVSTSWSAPDGSIINATEYTLENAVLTSQFTLDYQEDTWKVEGELQGKPIKTRLEHSDWLLSGFGSYLELKNLRASENMSGKYHMWVPSADPTSALPVVLSKLEGESNANFEIDMDVLVMKFLADEKGVFRHGTIAQGPILMKMELIYSKGEPTLP